ncbi:MAG: TIGR02444 family protein [Litorivicinus sp.]
MPVSLWDFALDKYRDPLIADLCIRLQDEHQMSVCELLWTAWLASQGRQVEAASLQHFRTLRGGLYLSIERLRGARRLLELDPVTRDLGQQTRPLEIAAEQRLLSELEQLPSEPIAGNPWVHLHRTLHPFGLEPAPAAQNLYTALLERLTLLGVQVTTSN